MSNVDVSWYALDVQPRFEKVVSQSLQAQGLETFLPLYLRRTRSSDCEKKIQLPLFPGYVFCKVNLSKELALPTPGLNSLAGSGNEPVSIRQSELDNIHMVLRSGTYCEPWPFVQTGELVEVEHGTLAGLRGFAVTVGNQERLVISLNLIQRSMCVKISRFS